ncbi:histidine--tRNA ligase, partial [bacterium]|nr:histidine--tRNA ligase [bacterium]
TPAMEHIDILCGKYGEDERLIYRLEKRGDKKNPEELGMRYDLTVPLARVIAMNPTIVFPFKRYQIQPAWRAERPQKGRYREFIQCDIDIIGSDSTLADCEIIAVTNEALSAIGFSKFKIMLNHRKILKGIADYAGIGVDKFTSMCAAIDKFDKIGFDGVLEELGKRGFDKKQIQKVMEVVKLEGDFESKIAFLSRIFKDSNDSLFGIGQIQEINQNLEYLGIPRGRVEFSIMLSRGLDYYTGPIYESIVEEPKIGSLSGGGRYDKLIGVFSGKEIPATGSSFGLERIFDVYEEITSEKAPVQSTDVLVLNFTDELTFKALELLKDLRAGNIKSDIYYNSKKDLRTQLAYASKKNIPFALIIGPDEIKDDKVIIKNLLKREQSIIPVTELIPSLRKMIGENARTSP